MALFKRTRPPRLSFPLLRCVARAAAVTVALASTATIAMTLPVPQGTGREVIVDNVKTAPGWQHSTGRPNSFENGYLSTWRDPGGSVTYQPQVDVAGIYGVYYWLPEGNIQLTSEAPYTVHDADGDFAYHVNQREEKGGKWKFLGNHRFATGTSGTITITSSKNDFTLADAIKLGAPVAEDLRTVMRRALAHGAREFTIPKGQYWSPDTLNLDGLDGLTIDAREVTFIKQNYGLAMETGTTKNLTVIGLTLNYDPLPFTQGRIEKVEPGKWIEVRLSTGYPRPDLEAHNGTLRQVIFNPATRLPKSQYLGTKTNWQNQAAGILRTEGTRKALVGDIVTLSWNPKGGNFGITIAGENTTLKDVTLHAAPGMGLMNARGEGNTVLDGFKVTPGPLPKDATEKPILSTNWDGIQFQAVRKGPTVRNSEVINAGDDSMSIQGLGSIKVLQVDGRVIWANFKDSEGRAKLLQSGDTLKQWMDESGAKISCTASQASAAETCGISSTYQGTPADGIWAIFLDRPAPSTWKAHTVLADVDRMGNGFRFENNTITSSGRGLLIKANNGDIIGNKIMGSNAISFSNEAGFDSHTNSGGNLRITDNVFTIAPWSGGDGVWNSCQVGVVNFDGSVVSRRLYPNVTIERNRFEDVVGLNLSIRNTSNVTVKDNVFLRSHQKQRGVKGNACDIPQGSVISVTASDDVRFSGNTMDRIGPYSEAPFFIDTRSTNVTGPPLLIEHPYLGINDGHTYSLTNRETGLLLTSAGSGLNVRQVIPSAQPALEWILENDAADSVRIRHGASGKYLTAGPATNTTVTLTDFADSDAQRWLLLDAANGTAKIQSLSTGQFLASEEPAKVEQEDRWKIYWVDQLVGQHPVLGTLQQSWALTDLTP